MWIFARVVEFFIKLSVQLLHVFLCFSLVFFQAPALQHQLLLQIVNELFQVEVLFNYSLRLFHKWLTRSLLHLPRVFTRVRADLTVIGWAVKRLGALSLDLFISSSFFGVVAKVGTEDTLLAETHGDNNFKLILGHDYFNYNNLNCYFR